MHVHAPQARSCSACRHKRWMRWRQRASWDSEHRMVIATPYHARPARAFSDMKMYICMHVCVCICAYRRTEVALKTKYQDSFVQSALCCCFMQQACADACISMLTKIWNCAETWKHVCSNIPEYHAVLSQLTWTCILFAQKNNPWGN
jgi:hypothetical protein